MARAEFGLHRFPVSRDLVQGGRRDLSEAVAHCVFDETAAGGRAIVGDIEAGLSQGHSPDCGFQPAKSSS